MSATVEYKSGRMDEALLDILKNYEEAVRNIILPTLGEERRKTYSPFLPIALIQAVFCRPKWSLQIHKMERFVMKILIKDIS